MSTPVLALWLFTIALKLILFAVLRLHYHHIAWPCFSRFVGWSAGKSLVLYAVADSRFLYYYGYYFGVFIDAVLLFLVARELCTEVFRPWCYAPKEIARKMAGYATFGLALCIVTSVAYKPDLLSPYLVVGRWIERVSITFLFGVFGVMAIASREFGIPWRRYAFGVGAGFIILLSVEAVTQAVLAPMLRSNHDVYRIFYMMGFPIAAAIWIWYFSGPEPERLPVKAEFLRQLVLKLTSVTAAIRLRGFTHGNYSVVIPDHSQGEYVFGQTKGEEPK